MFILYSFDHHLFSRGVRVFIQTVRFYVECVVYQKNRLFFFIQTVRLYVECVVYQKNRLFFFIQTVRLYVECVVYQKNRLFFFIQTVRLYVECVVYQKNRPFFSFRQCDSMLNVLCTNRTDFFEKARKKETGRNKERREKRKKRPYHLITAGSS